MNKKPESHYWQDFFLLRSLPFGSEGSNSVTQMVQLKTHHMRSFAWIACGLMVSLLFPARLFALSACRRFAAAKEKERHP